LGCASKGELGKMTKANSGAPPLGERKRVVLVGAGHAHLHVALHAAMLVSGGVEPVLVDPGDFWYSGLATGVVGGMYDGELDRIDPQPLVERRGGRFIRDRAVGLDRGKRNVRLASGACLPYDLLSLNVGSEIALDGLAAADERVWAVKPVSNLWRLRQHLERRFREAPGITLRVAVVGGGATGCEIAANVEALARRHGHSVRVTLVSGDERLLPRQARAVSRRLAALLRRRGIELALSCRAERIDPHAVVANGRVFETDLAVVATGLQPPRWLGALGLPLDEEGGLCVGPTLQSIADERVFGAGDCIRLEGHRLPKLGVFGVRQAPALLHNLQAFLNGQPLQTFEPQKRCLMILNLGCGRALALWGPFHWQGRLSLWLKDVIDRRFLAKYHAAT
jgi:NADH dehydrogenase FAD-containing subunit